VLKELNTLCRVTYGCRTGRCKTRDGAYLSITPEASRLILGSRKVTQRRCANWSPGCILALSCHDEMNRRPSSNTVPQSTASPRVRFLDRRSSAQSHGSLGDDAPAGVVEDDTIEKEIDEIKRYEVRRVMMCLILNVLIRFYSGLYNHR
jgi:hypothetical protein